MIRKEMLLLSSLNLFIKLILPLAYIGLFLSLALYYSFKCHRIRQHFQLLLFYVLKSTFQYRSRSDYSCHLAVLSPFGTHWPNSDLSLVCM